MLDSSVMTTQSVSAGEYAPPPADRPVMIEICGTAPGQRDDPVEDPPVAAERRHALLHPGAPGGDEPHHRRAGTVGKLQHAHDRVGVGLAERAAGVARVLGVAEHGAAVDQSRATDDAVAGPGLLPHRPDRTSERITCSEA